MTSHLLSPRAIADQIGVTTQELRTFRARDAFPEPDARIRRWLGWLPRRVDHFEAESLELVRMHVQGRGSERVEWIRPEWWEVTTVRYIGLPELAEAAVLSPSAVWSHYYNGKLPAPDITIGHVNRIAGWSPANAKRLAAAQGWRLDLARLDDTSGLAGEL